MSTDTEATQQTIKPSPWNQFRCWLGWHEWEQLEDGVCYFELLDCHLDYQRAPKGHRKCIWCPVVEDARCEECLEANKAGTCSARISKERHIAALRRNCCLHCPKESHNH